MENRPLPIGEKTALSVQSENTLKGWDLGQRLTAEITSLKNHLPGLPSGKLLAPDAIARAVLAKECLTIAEARKDESAYRQLYGEFKARVTAAIVNLSLNSPPPDELEHHFFDVVQADWHDATLTHLAGFLRELMAGKWQTYGRVGVDTLGRAFREWMLDCRAEAAKEMSRRENEAVAARELAAKEAHEKRKAEDPEYAAYWSEEAQRARYLAMIENQRKHKRVDSPLLVTDLPKPQSRERPTPKAPMEPLPDFSHLMTDYYADVPA